MRKKLESTRSTSNSAAAPGLVGDRGDIGGWPRLLDRSVAVGCKEREYGWEYVFMVHVGTICDSVIRSFPVIPRIYQ